MQITLREVTFSYHDNTIFSQKILDNLSFTIPTNQITVIIGRTGSGKSTLLQVLTGLLKPQEGFITIGATTYPNKKSYPQSYKDVGLALQFPEKQFFAKTVFEEISFGIKNYYPTITSKLLKERVKNALENIGLDYVTYRERNPFSLSDGEKRKLAIASILALDTEVIMLDEPTVGLDKQGIDDLINCIVALKNAGKTLIIVTHDLESIFKYIDQLVVLEQGHLQFVGKPSEWCMSEKRTEYFECPGIYRFLELWNKRREDKLDYSQNNIREYIVKEIEKRWQEKNNGA